MIKRMSESNRQEYVKRSLKILELALSNTQIQQRPNSDTIVINFLAPEIKEVNLFFKSYGVVFDRNLRSTINSSLWRILHGLQTFEEAESGIRKHFNL